MCKAEAEVRPGPNSLGKHGVEFGGPTGYIDGKMRAIAVSWLVEVTSEFDMHQETLFLAVNLLDRFLSVTKVSAHDLIHTPQQLSAICNPCDHPDSIHADWVCSGRQTQVIQSRGGTILRAPLRLQSLPPGVLLDRQINDEHADVRQPNVDRARSEKPLHHDLAGPASQQPTACQCDV